jgi:tol-pal system protein YbgF
VDGYDIVLKEYPDSLYADQAQYQLGIALFKSEKIDSSLLAFQSVLTNFPKSRLCAQAQYQVAQIYFRKGNFKDAAVNFRKVLDNYPEDESIKYDAMLQEGVSLYNMQEFQNALKVFKKVLNESPAEFAWRAKYQLGWCYYQLNQPNEAVAEFRDFLKSYPRSEVSADVLFWLGQFFYNQEKHDQAKPYFDALIKDFPHSELTDDAYYWLGVSIYQDKQSGGALRYWEKIVEDYPQSNFLPDALLRIGQVLWEEGKKDESTGKFREVIRKFPNTRWEKDAYYNLGQKLKESGKLTDAIDSIRRSLGESKDEYEAEKQFLIAECYEDLMRDEEAIAEYLKVGYLFPSAASCAVRAQLRAASLFEKLKKWEDAAKVYRKIADTTTDESKYAMERLKWIQENTSSQ